MEIDLLRCKLNKDNLREKMREVFQASSTHGRHYCYVDHEGRVYVRNAYGEIDRYLIFEIKSEMDVFLVTKLSTSDISINQGHTPEASLHVAVLNGKIATTKIEAIEFLISKVDKFLRDEGVDTCGVRDSLRKSLLKDGISSQK